MIPLCRLAVFAALAGAMASAQPNPYATIENWAKLPEGRAWGSTSAVEIDRDGKSVWVAERCGANTCDGKTDPPILEFDASGKLVQELRRGHVHFPPRHLCR